MIIFFFEPQIKRYLSIIQTLVPPNWLRLTKNSTKFQSMLRGNQDAFLPESNQDSRPSIPLFSSRLWTMNSQRGLRWVEIYRPAFDFWSLIHPIYAGIHPLRMLRLSLWNLDAIVHKSNLRYAPWYSSNHECTCPPLRIHPKWDHHGHKSEI